MEITLKMPTGKTTIDDNGKYALEYKEKTFVAPFISTRKLKNSMEFVVKLDVSKMDTNNLATIDLKMIDDIVKFLVDIFGNQFSFDEAYDGMEAEDLFGKFMECVQSITDKTGEKMTELGKANPNL